MKEKDTDRSIRASVIVSVYNHWEWLRLILDALSMQSVAHFEVIVADDGSEDSLRKNLEGWKKNHPEMRVKHSWHPDKGWRKNIALNKAVRMGEGEYLIFLDGDCVPHPEFIADHLALARRGRVVAGRRADLPQCVSDELANMPGLEAGYFRNIRKKVAATLLKDFGAAAACLRRMIRFSPEGGKVRGMKPGGILGCNFSLYRADFEMVDGFDERYLDPGTGEDTDIDIRLTADGVKAMKVSRCALTLHRRHARLPMSSPRNAALLAEAKAKLENSKETRRPDR